jgi:deazaflavin-dependent oxidoreductase (nitroreductase family)
MSNDTTLSGIPASLPTAVRAALSQGHLIDITTTGRRSGASHRVELVFHSFDGRLYISGRPGRRDWYANLVATPRFTFHLNGGTRVDLPAEARPITEPDERREVLTKVAAAWRTEADRLAASPLVEVTILAPLDGSQAAAA